MSLLEAPWQFLTELKRVLRLPHRKLSLDTEKKKMMLTEMRKILTGQAQKHFEKNHISGKFSLTLTAYCGEKLLN